MIHSSGGRSAQNANSAGCTSWLWLTPARGAQLTFSPCAQGPRVSAAMANRLLTFALAAAALLAILGAADASVSYILRYFPLHVGVTTEGVGAQCIDTCTPRCRTPSPVHAAQRTSACCYHRALRIGAVVPGLCKSNRKSRLTQVMPKDQAMTVHRAPAQAQWSVQLPPPAHDADALHYV